MVFDSVKEKWNESKSFWEFAKWAVKTILAGVWAGAKFVGNLLYKAIWKSD
jgi:hypothetical protein